MKNTYEIRNEKLEAMINKNNIKKLWKESVKNDPTSLILYLFLTKKNIKLAINKSFQEKNVSGNSVLKSFKFPKEAQYETVKLLMNSIALYAKENKLNSLFSKCNIFEIDYKNQACLNAVKFLKNLNLNSEFIMYLLGKVSSLFLELYDEYRLFNVRNIKWQKSLYLKTKNNLIKKSKTLSVKEKGNWDLKNIARLKRSINHYYINVNKIGNIEQRLRNTYQKRKENKVDDNVLMVEVLNIHAIENKKYDHRDHDPFSSPRPVTEFYEYKYKMSYQDIYFYPNELAKKIRRFNGLFQILFSLGDIAKSKNISFECKKSFGYSETGRTQKMIRMALLSIIMNEE